MMRIDFKFFCPHCGQRIESSSDDVGLNVACPICSQAFIVPEPPPSSTQNPSQKAIPTLISTAFSDFETSEVAELHKGILCLLLFSFISIFLLHSLFFNSIACLILFHQLARAFKKPYPWKFSVIGFILGYLPLVGFLALLFVNRKVTAALKMKGIEVGFLPVKRSDFLGMAETKAWKDSKLFFRPLWASVPSCLAFLGFIMSCLTLARCAQFYSLSQMYNSNSNAIAIGAFAGALFGDQTGFQQIEQFERDAKSMSFQMAEAIALFKSSIFPLLYFAVVWFGSKLIKRPEVH